MEVITFDMVWKTYLIIALAGCMSYGYTLSKKEQYDKSVEEDFKTFIALIGFPVSLFLATTFIIGLLLYLPFVVVVLLTLHTLRLFK